MTDAQGVMLERKLTWGGLLTIATILVTAGITWGVSQQTTSGMAETITEVKADVATLKNARYDDNTRMVRMETLLGEILEEVKKNR